jgi:regulator of replication initiation timing
LGKQALHGVNEPESSPQEDEDVQLRQQLILRDEELRSKEEENTRLRSENERLKRMLHALVDGVQL